MQNHSCLVEDLRVCANLLPKKRDILKQSLNHYADELAEYNPTYSKEYVSPFKIQTMNEAIANAKPAWQEQKDWAISPNGDLKHIKMQYCIPADRLEEEDWILHLTEKAWIDFNTFIPAYFEACRRAGIKNIKIITNYK